MVLNFFLQNYTVPPEATCSVLVAEYSLPCGFTSARAQDLQYVTVIGRKDVRMQGTLRAWGVTGSVLRVVVFNVHTGQRVSEVRVHGLSLWESLQLSRIQTVQTRKSRRQEVWTNKRLCTCCQCGWAARLHAWLVLELLRHVFPSPRPLLARRVFLLPCQLISKHRSESQTQQERVSLF